MKHLFLTLDLMLRLIVALEVLVYFGAALLHFGLRIPLGSLVLAVPNAIPAASVVETILGLAAATNLAALIRTDRRWKAITLGIHLFTLVGVLLGMAALAIRVSPPPSPDWTLHYVMLAGIATVMVLMLLLRKSRSTRKQGLSSALGGKRCLGIDYLEGI